GGGKMVSVHFSRRPRRLNELIPFFPHFSETSTQAYLLPEGTARPSTPSPVAWQREHNRAGSGYRLCDHFPSVVRNERGGDKDVALFLPLRVNPERHAEWDDSGRGGTPLEENSLRRRSVLHEWSHPCLDGHDAVVA